MYHPHDNCNQRDKEFVQNRIKRFESTLQNKSVIVSDDTVSAKDVFSLSNEMQSLFSRLQNSHSVEQMNNGVPEIYWDVVLNTDSNGRVINECEKDIVSSIDLMKLILIVLN